SVFAKKYIDAILSYQRPSGWICPCPDEKIPTYDTWAVQLISKVFVVYYDCSGDERIPESIYRMMKNYYDLLSEKKIKLFNWGKYRWFEAFVAIRFLLKRYDEPWIYELARILKAQGMDYSTVTELWKNPLNKWTYDTHIVNLTMMLKSEAISSEILNEPYTNSAERLYTLLKEYNGTPVGIFTGDECLSGLSPIQGTELCSVTEQMYSYEWLYAHTGDSRWAEELELLAFNALPATISDDMWTHQYVQMSNQIACKRFPGRSLFRTNNHEAHLFGLEPHFGCCTSNFNQGWPKLTLSAFMHNGDTVISAIAIPSTLKTDGLSIALKTRYPFENKLEYTVKTEKNVCFKVRIPSFAKNLSVNGRAYPHTEELSFDITAGKNEVISIEFDTVTELVQRPHDLKCVRCGSLVFSLPISYEKKMYEYEKNKVERKYPYCDYEYLPTSKWNYAYASPLFEVERREISDIPFSSQKPPVVIKAKVREIAWGFEEGFDSVCKKAPDSRAPVGETKEIELYPYGSAKLRVTELPLI
ncbi:MAG: hypothetical protein E7673_07760, partial [Ruminococcaceae bacterium]|nr:hypothetical protein [Oscillospiraceae bacterium]